LVDQNNVFVLIRGDNLHALIGMGSTADGESYFADRQAHGFNAVWMNMLVAAPAYYDSRDDGSTPKVFARSPVTSAVVPVPFTMILLSQTKRTLLVSMRWSQLRQIMALAVFLDPIDTCCKAAPARTKWLQALLANGLVAAAVYGRYVGERYKRFNNVIWLHGDDFNTWQTHDDDAVVQAVAKAIKSADPQARHTVELNVPTSSSLDDGTWPTNISLNSTYSYSPTYIEMLRSYNQKPVMPTYLVEGNYDLERSAIRRTMARRGC
jgi:hypothetical protein